MLYQLIIQPLLQLKNNMHTSRRTRQSASYVEHRRKKAAWVLVGFIVSVSLAVALFSWLTKLSMFKIYNVRIDGADPDITASLQTAAESVLSGSYFGIFSKSNAFIYPRGAVARAVKEASGRVESVETHLNDLHQISITITEKSPAALACPDFPNLDSNDISSTAQSSTINQTNTVDQCYFTDKSGLIYAEAPDLSGNIYPRYYIPEVSSASSTALIGDYATSTEAFVRLQSFYSVVQNAGIKIESVLIKEKGEYEMYVQNPDMSIAIIYFNESRPLTDELTNLVSFWNYMITDARTTKKLISFDYIDVRYGTNVFYRVNGGAISSK